MTPVLNNVKNFFHQGKKEGKFSVISHFLDFTIESIVILKAMLFSFSGGFIL